MGPMFSTAGDPEPMGGIQGSGERHHLINVDGGGTMRSLMFEGGASGHGACEILPNGSDVSQRFCQGKKLVHICMESEQSKTKSNPGKFWRKCSFSDF